MERERPALSERSESVGYRPLKHAICALPFTVPCNGSYQGTPSGGLRTAPMNAPLSHVDPRTSPAREPRPAIDFAPTRP